MKELLANSRPAIVGSRSLDSIAAVFLAGVFLATLTVKAWQEVAGVRVISTTLPVLFLMLLMRANRSIVAPRPVMALMLVECIVLPVVSVFAKGRVTFYELYLPWTCLSALIFINFFRRFVSPHLIDIGTLYAKSLVPICVLTVLFTFNKTWFGAYTLTSLSDFSTFFALQLSLAIPFVRFRGTPAVLTFFLIVLWFLFSRLSLVLSALGMLYQRVNLRSRKSLLIAAASMALVAAAGVMLAQTNTGSVLSEKLTNSISTVGSATSGNGIEGLNPSDLGRIAYIYTTFEAVTRESMIIGHGIKTNHDIIAERLDPSLWNLDDSFTQGATHNVYIELFSDCGAITTVAFLMLAYFVLARLKRRGTRDAAFISALTFFASYLFEGNYCTFFFQFFLIYFVWLASNQSTKALPFEHSAR